MEEKTATETEKEKAAGWLALLAEIFDRVHIGSL